MADDMGARSLLAFEVILAQAGVKRSKLTQISACAEMI
jgi:hypothetical protein